MRIYIIDGTRNGMMCNLLVTTNLEKAKAFLIGDGNGIEVWENEQHIGTIYYYGEDGFLIDNLCEQEEQK